MITTRLAERLTTEGWERRKRAATDALHGTDLAETAFRLATAVAFVDDTIAHAEAAALDAFAAALDLDASRVGEIMADVRAELFGDA